MLEAPPQKPLTNTWHYFGSAEGYKQAAEHSVQSE